MQLHGADHVQFITAQNRLDQASSTGSSRARRGSRPSVMLPTETFKTRKVVKLFNSQSRERSPSNFENL
jgi:hypothetical protein